MKLAVVTVRFGEEVMGGAERLAWEIGHRLSDEVEIHILTTCALDYRTWANDYPEGSSRIGQLRIHRFPVAIERNWERFSRYTSLLCRLSRLAKIPSWLEEKWLVHQGPYCPQLISFIESEKTRFDRFLFVTCLYYPTVVGLPLVREKSVLLPTAHDEFALKLNLYNRLMHDPRAIIFLSQEEKDFVQRRFNNRRVPCVIAGLGVETSEPETDSEGFFLYAGRIEAGKNCEEMFEYCARAGVELRAVGSTQISIPENVVYLGFVSEKEKRDLLSRCTAVIIPSKHESLSIITLEAWAMGKPVVVHKRSPVLFGHVNRCGGGYSYGNFEEFNQIVRNIDPGVGVKGWRYVKKFYSWDTVLPKYRQILRNEN